MKKVFTKKAVVVSLLCALSGAAAAEDIGYTYAQGGFGKGDDAADTSMLSVSGSYAINESVYVKGQFDSFSGDENGVDIDGTGFGLSAGYHMSVADKTDIYGEVGFGNKKADVKVGGRTVKTVKSDGALLGVGVRSRLNDMFEVEGAVRHFDSDASIDVQGMYHLSDQFAIGANVNSINDSEERLIGVFARVKSF